MLPFITDKQAIIHEDLVQIGCNNEATGVFFLFLSSTQEFEHQSYSCEIVNNQNWEKADRHTKHESQMRS